MFCKMDVYNRMKKVLDNNYIALRRGLDPGLIANHMKSVLSQGEADHYNAILLPTKTREQQCETLLDKITLHDKWWIHFIEALEKCGKVSLASPFKDELKRIESENQKLSKGKRLDSTTQNRSRSSLTDANSASPSASSAVLRRRKDSDDLSSGISADNDPTGLPVRVCQPWQTGAAACGRNLACGKTDESMDQNGPIPNGKILIRKDDISLECDSLEYNQRTFTLDTPLRQAPGILIMSIYRHLDSKTRTGSYEDLAGELGFNLEHLRTFVNTESVIQRFSQIHPKRGTFRVLMEALHRMGRKDVLEDIKEHTGLVCQTKDEDEELQDTSTKTMSRTCEGWKGRVTDRCDDVPEEPGVIPSDFTHAAHHGGCGIPSNISLMKFSAPAAKPSKARTIPTKKTHDETSEISITEDDLATAVHLQKGVMAMNGHKTEEDMGVHDKRMAADSMSEIAGNIDDGAKPPPIPKVLPGDSGTGARPKLYSTNHDQRDIYFPPDDINGRPTRKQLPHGRSNRRSPSLCEDSCLRSPYHEGTEHGGQAPVPTQSKHGCQAPVPTQSKHGGQAPVPTQSKHGCQAPVPTQSKHGGQAPVPTQSKHGCQAPVPTQSKHGGQAPVPTQSKHGGQAPVPTQSKHGGQAPVPTQSKHGGQAPVPTQSKHGGQAPVPTQSKHGGQAPVPTQSKHGGQAPVPTQSQHLSRKCPNIPNFDYILSPNMESKKKEICEENGTTEPDFANFCSLSQYSENGSVHDRLAKEVLEKEHLRGGKALEIRGSDGTSTVAAPDNSPICDHSSHTREDIGPIQGSELQKTEMSHGPCLSIDDSEFESSCAEYADEEMVTGADGNCSSDVNPQVSTCVEQNKTPFLPNWKILLLKVPLLLHDCMYTNSLPNWRI